MHLHEFMKPSQLSYLHNLISLAVPPLCFDNLPTISNGGITYNNGQATYNCFGDYRLVGDAMRTCGSEGIWGGSAPVCQRKE